MARVGATSRKTGIDLDTDEFLDGLERAIRKAKLHSAEDLKDFGAHAADTIALLAPSGPTGQLEEGIDYKMGKDQHGPYVDVISREFYGHFSEFGTSKMRARPFFRPGLARAAQAFPSFFRRVFR